MGASVLNELGGSDVTDLDVLVLAMVVVGCLHARRESALRGESLRGGYMLLIASALVGLVTEFGSIRFGGTHCHHASAYANFATCSSANSVLYYAPWIYCCVATAVRLTGSNRDGEAGWALPWICGALTFGVCGVYEMQGPLMQWWEWPAFDTRFLAADQANPRGHSWRPFFRFLHTGYNSSTPGWAFDGPLLMSPHAAEALEERLWGFPVMAPYFDLFFGWGIGAALWLAHRRCGTVFCIIFGPFLALFWDLPVRALISLSVPRAVSVPSIMGLAIIVPLLLLPSGLERCNSASEHPDWLLFAMPLLNQLYFVHHALTCGYGDHSPVGLKMVVVVVATCSLVAHAIGAGLICSGDSTSLGFDRASAKRKNGRRGSSRSASPVAQPYSRNSFLDRLQKNAHASELDHTNTSPSTFLVLALIQLPICYYLATWMELPTYTAWFPIFSHVAGFLWGHYVLHSDKWFDVWGECTLFVTFTYSYYDIQEPTSRQCLATALALLWTVRLGVFLGWRIIQRGSDWRFTKLVEGGPAYNVFGWVSQGTWIFLQGMAIWVVQHGPLQASNAPVRGCYAL